MLKESKKYRPDPKLHKEFTPTGKKFSNGTACQIIEVQNGKVTQINHYFDILTIMNQLGLV